MAASLSGQVSANSSGFLLNRSTKLYGGTLTISNTSGKAIPGSINVLFSNLTAGVTLSQASVTVGGTAYSLAITQTPNGAYVHVPTSLVSQIAAGSSLQIAVYFTDPSGTSIGFTPLTFSDPLDS